MSNRAFTKDECFERIPDINAPITVLGIFSFISACFPIKAREPFLTTIIMFPTFTFSEVPFSDSTYTLSASTISPFLTLEDLNTNVPDSLTSSGVYVNPLKNSTNSGSLRCSQVLLKFEQL